MNTPGPQQQDAEQASAARGAQVERAMPGLVRAAGWDSLGPLREESCNDSPHPEKASSATRWFSSAGRPDVSEGEARSITEAVREYAESTGWTGRESTGGPRLLYAAGQDDLTLVVRHATGSGAGPLSVEISTPCLDMPEGHTMTRSGLDSMYGSPDPMYPNDDRSKFTNGTPKPLPSPAE
jgi:hypothetical protein